MSGSASTFSDAYKKRLAIWWEAQARVYSTSSNGWMQWPWRTEDGAGEECVA